MMRRCIAGVLILVVFATLLSLGFWQIQRLHWKESLIAQITQAQNIPARPLDDIINLPDTEQPFRAAIVGGTLLFDKMVYVGLRQFDGQPGYDVIVPMRITMGAYSGYHLLINLGWVPVQKFRTWQPPASLVGQETVVMQGVFRHQEPRTWMTPDNIPQTATWFNIHIQEIASTYGLKPFMPFYLQRSERLQEEEQLPKLELINPDLRNDHLQYAVTWFSLSVIWLVMVALRMRPARKTLTPPFP